MSKITKQTEENVESPQHKYQRYSDKKKTTNHTCLCAIDSGSCIRCYFCLRCFGCVDCEGCTDCNDCEFCVNCEGLQGAKYMINNRPATLEELEKNSDMIFLSRDIRKQFEASRAKSDQKTYDYAPKMEEQISLKRDMEKKTKYIVTKRPFSITDLPTFIRKKKFFLQHVWMAGKELRIYRTEGGHFQEELYRIVPYREPNNIVFKHEGTLYSFNDEDRLPGEFLMTSEKPLLIYNNFKEKKKLMVVFDADYFSTISVEN